MKNEIEIKIINTTELVWEGLHPDYGLRITWGEGNKVQAPSYFKDENGYRECAPEFDDSDDPKNKYLFARYITSQLAAQIDRLSELGVKGKDFMARKLMTISFNPQIYQKSLDIILKDLSPHCYLLDTDTAIKQYEVDTKEFGWRRVTKLIEEIDNANSN